MVEGEVGRSRAAPWQLAVGAAAVAAAALAVWMTLRADFLAFPGWLAVQKADFILGPVFIGIYWLRRRPESRFGPLLIAFGFVGAVYVLQSSSEPWLFSIGLVWENVIYLATLALIVTFPTGRLDGAAPKLILIAGLFAAALPATAILLVLPQVGAGGSISGCREACPENVLAVTSNPSLALTLFDVFRIGAIGVALATAGLLAWRLARGTPPQRRALAIGASIASVFLVLQITYLTLTIVAPESAALQDVVRWAFAAARAAIWYGFLAALVAAQLFAARAMQRLVRQSLQRPSQGQLEAMLREPLGDPELELVFLDASDGAKPEVAAEDRAATVVADGGGRAAVALLHDAQLDDDPELLQAAGAVALLAAENAELDGAWHEALQELRRSRARIVRAGDRERRRFERNLHDGVQQRLVAVAIELDLAGELAGNDQLLGDRLGAIGARLDEAIDELREVSHGLHPPVLSDFGLVAALEGISGPRSTPLTIRATGVGRHSLEVESAVYYCCVEAIQNAIKHAGPGARISVTLGEDQGELRFDVADSGNGFDPSASSHGTGLQNMRDRLGALDGRLAIITAPGRGTVVSGSIPLFDNRPEGG